MAKTITLLALAALAATAGAGALTLDVKFIFMVGIQLVTFGGLYGSMRSNARHMGKQIDNLDVTMRREVFPRIHKLEIQQARDEGRDEGRAE